MAEVVVTAQRRESKLSETPVSVTAFSGQQLANEGITTLDQLTAKTPNFEYVDTGLLPRYRVRGDGLQVFNDTSDSPVGFAVDDVFYGANALQRAPLYDVRDVEVLRGPQGTLFGRNTTAGLVQVTTNRPLATFQGDASAQYGSYNQRIIDADVTGPLTNRLQGRLSLYYNQDDGWQKNEAIPDGQRWSATDVFSLRGQLQADLWTNATLLVKAEYTQNTSVGPMISVQGALTPGTLAPCSNGAILANSCVTSVGFHPAAPKSTFGYSDHDGLPDHLNFAEYTAHFDWDITPYVKLVSITGLLNYGRFYQEDGDGTAVGSSSGNETAQYRLRGNQFSEEVQLKGDLAKRLDWVTGVFYYHDHKLSQSTVPELFDGLYDTTGIVTTQSEAVFANVDYKLTDAIGVQGGIRYTHEEKSADLLLLLGPNATYKVDVDKPTWRVGANWKPIQSLYLFADVSTGYKSPDFNTTFLFGNSARAAPTAPETSMNYEVGAKWKVLENRLDLSATLFDDYVRNKQSTVSQFTNGLFVTQLFNFGNVDLRGAEFELTGKPTHALTTQLGVALLDTEIRAAPTTVFRSGPASIATPVDGKQLTATPHYKVNGLVRYDFPTTDYGQFAMQWDFTYTAHQYFALDNNPRDAQDAYGLVNLRLFWTDPSKRYQVQVFGDNLTDKDYISYAGTFSGSDVRSIWWGKPRTFGIRGAVHF